MMIASRPSSGRSWSNIVPGDKKSPSSPMLPRHDSETDSFAALVFQSSDLLASLEGLTSPASIRSPGSPFLPASAGGTITKTRPLEIQIRLGPKTPMSPAGIREKRGPSSQHHHSPSRAPQRKGPYSLTHVDLHNKVSRPTVSDTLPVDVADSDDEVADDWAGDASLRRSRYRSVTAPGSGVGESPDYRASYRPARSQTSFTDFSVAHGQHRAARDSKYTSRRLEPRSPPLDVPETPVTANDPTISSCAPSSSRDAAVLLRILEGDSSPPSSRMGDTSSPFTSVEGSDQGILSAKLLELRGASDTKAGWRIGLEPMRDSNETASLLPAREARQRSSSEQSSIDYSAPTAPRANDRRGSFLDVRRFAHTSPLLDSNSSHSSADSSANGFKSSPTLRERRLRDHIRRSSNGSGPPAELPSICTTIPMPARKVHRVPKPSSNLVQPQPQSQSQSQPQPQPHPFVTGSSRAQLVKETAMSNHQSQSQASSSSNWQAKVKAWQDHSLAINLQSSREESSTVAHNDAPSPQNGSNYPSREVPSRVEEPALPSRAAPPLLRIRTDRLNERREPVQQGVLRQGHHFGMHCPQNDAVENLADTPLSFVSRHNSSQPSSAVEPRTQVSGRREAAHLARIGSDAGSDSSARRAARRHDGGHGNTSIQTRRPATSRETPRVLAGVPLRPMPSQERPSTHTGAVHTPLSATGRAPSPASVSQKSSSLASPHTFTSKLSPDLHQSPHLAVQKNLRHANSSASLLADEAVLSEQDIEVTEERHVEQHSSLFGIRRRLVSLYPDLGSSSLWPRSTNKDPQGESRGGETEKASWTHLASERSIRRAEEKLEAREAELSIEALSKREDVSVQISVYTEQREGRWIVRGPAPEDASIADALPDVVDVWQIPIDAKAIVERKKLKSNIEMASTRTVVLCTECSPARSRGVELACRLCKGSGLIERVYVVTVTIRIASFVPLRLPSVHLVGSRLPDITYVEGHDEAMRAEVLRERALDGTMQASKRVIRQHGLRHGARLLMAKSHIERRGLMTVGVYTSRSTKQRVFNVSDGTGKVNEVKEGCANATSSSLSLPLGGRSKTSTELGWRQDGSANSLSMSPMRSTASLLDSPSQRSGRALFGGGDGSVTARTTPLPPLRSQTFNVSCSRPATSASAQASPHSNSDLHLVGSGEGSHSNMKVPFRRNSNAVPGTRPGGYKERDLPDQHLNGSEGDAIRGPVAQRSRAGSLQGKRSATSSSGGLRGLFRR